ncbi:MAG: hypothetical protein IKJ35_02225 [Clostridia bacterium]|nr:hypothetical protein [Clostridia bacterium]
MNETKGSDMICAMKKHKTAIYIALGVTGGVALLGAAAVAVWNSKQLRTARAVKRTSKILYQVGTAMRNVSCMEDH